MTFPRSCRFLAAAILWCALFAGSTPELPQLAQVVAADLKDFQATVKIDKADRSELNKINRDFALAYSLRDLTMRYKEPNKLRMEGRVAGTLSWIIFNGRTRYFRIPQLYTKKDDLGDSPGRRYSLFDIGLLTPSALSTLESKYLRSESCDGVNAQVFEASYRGDDTAKYTVWVDPEKRLILRRAWYDASGKLKAVFRYQDHRELRPGLWAPARLEVRNGEDAVAGVTTYSDMKVNEGLDDSLFTIS
jgi:outer membrane lipoprotein-sorting protein